MTNWRFAFAVVSLSLWACGGDGGVPDPRAPYGPLTATMVGQARGDVPLMPAGTMYTAGVVGQKVVDGQTYQEFKIGHDVPAGESFGPTTPGTVVYVQGMGTNTLTLGGFQGQNGLVATVATPAKVNLNPPVGVPQTVAATATITSLTDPTGKPASATLTYTLVEDDVTLTGSRLGDVPGCRRFTGSATVSGEALPPILQDMTVTGEVWYHPNYGIVDVKIPDLGFDLGMEGENDWGQPVDGVVVGRMMTVLDGTRTDVSFDTYDREGTLDADMCVHAKMLVEVRWANEADAKTRGMPDPTLFRTEFNGGMGTFCWGGCALTESPVSIFHPEENGKGYTFWYAYVSQAQKNMYQPGDDKGSSYDIRAVKDPSLPPIRVTARIAYALPSESSDCSMK